MRKVRDDDFGQPSSTAFFVTVSFVLIVGIIVLFMYSRNVIQQKNNEIYGKDTAIAMLEHDLKQSEKYHKQDKIELNKFKLLKAPTVKSFITLRAEKAECDAKVKTLEVEIEVYEEVQNKSNTLIKMLMTKNQELINNSKKELK